MPARKERKSIICPECGIEFNRLACQLTRGRGKYCSKACLGKSKRHGSSLFCALCDSPFYRRFGEQDLGERENQFCSRKCYGEWRVINRSPGTYPRTGSIHRHRIVAEAVLGRPLLPKEIVHHIDEDRTNFHPSNLAVFPDQSFHARCHFGKMSDEELRGFSIVKKDSG